MKNIFLGLRFMHVLVVYAHPSEKSFNHLLYAHTLDWLQKKGHQVKARNLYKMRFNPVLDTNDLAAIATGKGLSEDILKEQAYVAWADVLIFIYPIWWWDRPAILKGWFDRVFSRGFAFDYTEQGPIGKLTQKKALVIQTVGMPTSYPEIMEKGHLFKRSIAEGSLAYSGITSCEILSLHGLLWSKWMKISEYLRDVNSFLETNLSHF